MNLLIKDGIIIDGTSSSRFKADILIKDEKIHKIAQNIEQNADHIINANGKIVSPGFIDMHHHGDLMILEVPKAESSIMQGCTTLVVGVCGLSLAPSNDLIKDYYQNFVSNAFGMKGIHLYNNFQDLFDAILKKGISPNLAFFLPHGNVRGMIMGLETRKANDQEIKQMNEIVKENMEMGAFGLSTGLIYPPGSVTSTEEIIELCKIIRKYDGIYASHMRNEGTGVVSEGMNELIEICREAGVQGQISHWKAGSAFAWKLTDLMIENIRKVREAGLEIYADMYPYEESSTSLTGALLRPWVYENFNENLTNPKTRKRIIEETLDLFFENFLSDLPWYIRIIPKSLLKHLIFYAAKKSVRIISVAYNHQVEGLFLGEALNKLYSKKKFVDALLDFMRDEEGSIMISMKQMSEKKSILKLIKEDYVCIGSDGFLVKDANTHPRSYGTFPKILGDYVRNKRLFTLEEAVYKMTGLPAKILKLKDRGIIKEGYYADLVIFDENKIIDKANYQNGRQFPEGIEYVIINGEITAKKNNHTGALKGKILKHYRPD